MTHSKHINLNDEYERRLLGELSDLRKNCRFNEAYQHLINIPEEKKQLINYSKILWNHHPVWWSDISAGAYKLTRRRKSDAAFMRKIWTSEFSDQFNRHVSTLPNSDEELERRLQSEYSTTVYESRSIHWVARDASSNPFGILSLVNISTYNKRAEVLFGVTPQAPFGLSMGIMLMLFNFFFKSIRYNKLYSFVYKENKKSLQTSISLGFKTEGLLRSHVQHPYKNEYMDLVQMGMLEEDAFTQRNIKLMDKLLGAAR